MLNIYLANKTVTGVKRQATKKQRKRKTYNAQRTAI